MVLAGSHPEPAAPDDSPRRHAFTGWIILALFFGVFGMWAATAPLHGAAVSDAVVKVQGNRKSLQHAEGGTVKELRVREGDRVEAGDVLIVLDDTRAQAEYDILMRQQEVLKATEIRLAAEFARNSTLIAPEDFQARIGDPDVSSVWTAQTQEFASRQAALEAQRRVIQEKIEQLEEQIAGNRQQAAAYTQQIESVREELENISPLVERGLIARRRQLQLERNLFELEGQVAETRAQIASANHAIAEQTEQSTLVGDDRVSEVARELRDTQSQLLEIGPRIANARAALDNTKIRAPYSGTVVGLQVFAVGAVVSPGEQILDIVPDNDGLTIEARIPVESIADVRPGMEAEVHFTAYQERIAPMIRGEIALISADRLTDERTGIPYYAAVVELNEDELGRFPEIQLYPGMPARVMIPTIERTALDYLIGPLTESLGTAFRAR